MKIEKFSLKTFPFSVPIFIAKKKKFTSINFTLTINETPHKLVAGDEKKATLFNKMMKFIFGK